MAMDFTTRGVKPELGSVYAERFAVALKRNGVAVITQKDIGSLLSVERQRQLLGCADEKSSCLAELSGALGAAAIVTGQVGQIGNDLNLSLKVLHVQRA